MLQIVKTIFIKLVYDEKGETNRLDMIIMKRETFTSTPNLLVF